MTKFMIAALVVIICCSESWVESLPWSVWPFGVGQMRQNYAPVVWPDEMAIYHPVYRRQSAFLPQQLRHRPLRKSDGLSRGSAWINPSSVEVDSLFSFRGDREVALKPASGGILFAGDDDDSVIGGTHKQVHHRRPTPPPATTTTTTPCPLTTSTSNYEPVKGMDESSLQEEPVFNISKCESESSLFCEDLDDYPSEAIASIVQSNLNIFSGFFNNEEDDKKASDRDVPMVGLRIGPQQASVHSAQGASVMHSAVSFSSPVQDEDMSLCESQSRWMQPTKAKNANNEWLYVVNQENMTQGIWTEKCWEEEGSCKYADNFPIGYRTVCKQKYSIYKLVVINKEGKMQIENFRFPTCCSCHVRTTPIFQRSAAAAAADISSAAASNRIITKSPAASSTRQPANVATKQG